MAERFRSMPDVARYASLRPDGSVVYFESDGKTSNEGELPPGQDPDALKAQGFTFLTQDAYERTRRSLDPLIRAEEADADLLSEAFDASMGNEMNTTPNTQSAPGASLSPDMMNLLQQYMSEGRLDELFQPYQQEQNVLDQQMQLAQGMRQRGPQRSTPTGALFGGLSNAVGNTGGSVLQQKALEGQAALGKRQQEEAAGRVAAILRAMQQRRGTNPESGLMTPAVDDATLAALFAGG